MFIIPLTSNPNQHFICSIPVNGGIVPLDFILRYNTQADYWVMTVTNAQTLEIYAANIPLTAGVYPAANLLGQFAHLRIGSCAIVRINPDNTDYAPNAYNLGTDFALGWGDNYE